MEAVLAGLAGKQIGASHGVKDGRNLYRHIACVGVGLLAVARELDAEMADPARREAAGKGERRGFGRDDFLPIVTDRVVGDRASGVEEDIVRSPVSRRVDAQGKLVMRREIDVELAERGVADLRGGIFSGERGEAVGGGEDQGLIVGLVVAGSGGAGAKLRNHLSGAVKEFDYVGRVKDMLVKSGEEEDFVLLDGAADGGSGLLLAAVRLEGEERVGGAECAVAEDNRTGAVRWLEPGFRDDVDDGSAGAAEFGAIGVGGDAKLLHGFGGEIVRLAVASAGLGVEGVVVVAAVDEEAVLESSNAAEGEIAIGGRGEAARILRDAGGEQGEIGEAAAIEGKVSNGALIEQGGDGAGLGLDKSGGAGDGDIFLSACDGEMEFEFGGGANVDVELRAELRRHAFGRRARGVVAGRKQFQGEAAFGVAGCRVARPSRDIDDNDGRLRERGFRRVKDGATKGSGGGVLSVGGDGQRE